MTNQLAEERLRDLMERSVADTSAPDRFHSIVARVEFIEGSNESRARRPWTQAGFAVVAAAAVIAVLFMFAGNSEQLVEVGPVAPVEGDYYLPTYLPEGWTVVQTYGTSDVVELGRISETDEDWMVIAASTGSDGLYQSAVAFAQAPTNGLQMLSPQDELQPPESVEVGGEPGQMSVVVAPWSTSGTDEVLRVEWEHPDLGPMAAVGLNVDSDTLLAAAATVRAAEDAPFTADAVGTLEIRFSGHAIGQEPLDATRSGFTVTGDASGLLDSLAGDLTPLSPMWGMGSNPDRMDATWTTTEFLSVAVYPYEWMPLEYLILAASGDDAFGPFAPSTDPTAWIHTEPLEADNGRLLIWIGDGVSIFVLGNAPEDELLATATGLRAVSGSEWDAFQNSLGTPSTFDTVPGEEAWPPSAEAIGNQECIVLLATVYNAYQAYWAEHPEASSDSSTDADLVPALEILVEDGYLSVSQLGPLEDTGLIASVDGADPGSFQLTAGGECDGYSYP